MKKARGPLFFFFLIACFLVPAFQTLAAGKQLTGVYAPTPAPAFSPADRLPAMPDRYGLTVHNGLGPDVHKSLEQLALNGKELETRLAALWTLHGLGSTWRWDSRRNDLESWPDVLQKFLSSSEPAIRAWAVRFSAEQLRSLSVALDRNPNADTSKNARSFLQTTLSAFEKLASDPDPSVRLAVATAARQLVSSSLTVDIDLNPSAPVGKILAALIKSSADAKDPLLPFMIWMAGEPSFAANPEGGLNWLAENGPATMPLSGILAGKAMRRICDTQETPKLDSAVRFLSSIAQTDNSIETTNLSGHPTAPPLINTQL